MRVMFVDDEPSVLNGIQAMLAGQDESWDFRFAGGAKDALAQLSDEPFDVVVSDLDMPEMDGAELLRRVNRLYPETVRVVLSEDVERSQVLRAVPVAQQFLAKPCELAAFTQIIDRIHELAFDIQNDRVREIIARVDKLPSVPDVYTELSGALVNPDCTPADVARIVDRDPAIAAKLLQVVNSALFRRGVETRNTKDAVLRLGVRMIQSLVLAANVFDSPELSSSSDTGFSIFELQSDALLTAEIARRLPCTAATGDLMTAALMHDIGRLLIASQLPEEFQRILALCESEQISMLSAEFEVLGVSHADVGGHLLNLWGLPEPVVEAVSWHHLGPRWQAEPVLDLSAALYIAVCLARGSEVDPELARAWDITDKLADWRDMASDLGEQS